MVAEIVELWALNATICRHCPYGGGARNSPTQGLTSQTGELNLRGYDHAPIIISLLEGRKHHAIFRKDNRNN